MKRQIIVEHAVCHGVILLKHPCLDYPQKCSDCPVKIECDSQKLYKKSFSRQYSDGYYEWYINSDDRNEIEKVRNSLIMDYEVEEDEETFEVIPRRKESLFGDACSG